MSKYLEYTRYANTGATAASAPVLGSFSIREKLALEALCEEIKLNGGTPMDTETLLYIISGTLEVSVPEKNAENTSRMMIETMIQMVL